MVESASICPTADCTGCGPPLDLENVKQLGDLFSSDACVAPFTVWPFGVKGADVAMLINSADPTMLMQAEQAMMFMASTVFNPALTPSLCDATTDPGGWTGSVAVPAFHEKTCEGPGDAIMTFVKTVSATPPLRTIIGP
jgi:hypothetical protein